MTEETEEKWWDDHIIKNEWSTDREIAERDESFKKMESDGIIDTQKYFDRMHDKIFNLNNMMIAAYFALIAFKQDVANWILFVPLFNLLALLKVDYLMLQRARIQANITSVGEKDLNRYGTITKNANLYSLLCILSTLIVLAVFCYFLIKE